MAISLPVVSMPLRVRQLDRSILDADTAEKMAKEEGKDVIRVRPFTKPDDVHGMLAAKGILTSEGGATSHAAVVARQFGCTLHRWCFYG